MASLVHDTLAWLRFYSALPIPPLAGEDPAQAPDPAATAHLVPVAGAAVGAVGAIILIAASGLRLPPLLAATLAVTALVIVTGCRAGACARPNDRAARRRPSVQRSPRRRRRTCAHADAVSCASAPSKDFIVFGALRAALALIAACAVSRAVALAMTPDFASRSTTESGFSPFQRLALATLVIAAALVLPTYGIGAAVAGIAAAVGAAAGVMALAPKLSSEDRRPLASAAEQAAEIAFLVAVLIFAGPA